MEKLVETYGFDLKNIINEARTNGNEELALELEKQVANLQACFDIIAQRHTSAPDMPIWKIDAKELRMRLK